MPYARGNVIANGLRLAAGLKWCPACQQTLPVGLFFFSQHRRDGLSSYCRACGTADTRTYYRAHRRPDIQTRVHYENQDDRERARAAQGYRHVRTPKGRFHSAKSYAKRAGLEWTLTFEQYAALIVHPCAYHGGPLHETSSGLDRLDSGRGYHADNVVACCWLCNHVKSNVFTPAEMQLLGPVVAGILKARGLVLPSRKLFLMRRGETT